MRCLVIGVVLAVLSVPAFADDGKPEPVAPTTNPWLRAAAVGALITTGVTVVYVMGALRINDLEDQSERAQVAGNEAEVQRINASGERWSTITKIGALTSSITSIATIVFLVKGIRLRERRAAATTVRLAPIAAPRIAGMHLDVRW
jgi:energy-converting hydrogenase Eha subunit C